MVENRQLIIVRSRVQFSGCLPVYLEWITSGELGLPAKQNVPFVVLGSEPNHSANYFLNLLQGKLSESGLWNLFRKQADVSSVSRVRIPYFPRSRFIYPMNIFIHRVFFYLPFVLFYDIMNLVSEAAKF